MSRPLVWITRLTLAVPLLAIGGCSSAPVEMDVGESASELNSGERVQVFPSSRQRVACREVANRYYCTKERALAAVEECSGEDAASAATFESSAASCSRSAALYPSIASCRTPLPHSCAFYSACLERAIPCGEQGYALGFGERYCTAFRNAKLSDKGTAWATSVMGCLEEALVSHVEDAGSFTTKAATATACTNVLNDAFFSHPACYTKPAHSICFLPPQDLAMVVKTIGAQELFMGRTRTQIMETLKLCGAQLVSALEERLLHPGGGPTKESTSVELPPEAFSLERADIEARRAVVSSLLHEYESAP